MTFRPSQQAGEAAYADQQARMAQNSIQTTQRLMQAYMTCPDRAFATEFWGEMLTERGVDISLIEVDV